MIAPRRTGALLAVAALLAAGLTVAGAPVRPAAATPTDALSTWAAAKLPLANNGIAFDPTRGVLLVAVDGSVPTVGNGLVEVDPETGALGRSVALGGEPDEIAVSDDGTRAYVGFAQARIVAEIDLVSFSVVRRFGVPNGSYSSLWAQDIEVQPGRADVIAVSLIHSASPNLAGVVIYEDGVRRTESMPGHTGPNNIAFGADPGTLYGQSNAAAARFYTMAVDADGVHEVSSARLLASPLDFVYADGTVTSHGGRVADPVTGAVQGSYERSGRVVVDAAEEQAFILASGTLTRHDTTTLLQDDSKAVPITTAEALVDTGVGLAASDETSIVLLGPTVTGTGFALPAAPPSLVRTERAVSAPLSATDIAAAGNGERLYAVTTSTDAQPQELVELDAVTGERRRHVFVGGTPNVVEVTDDGSRILIGHSQANRVTEVDAETFTILRTVPLPAGPNQEPTSAGVIVPVPGSSTQYVVRRNRTGTSPSNVGLVLVDDGVVQPVGTSPHFSPDTFAFTSDPAVLYGYITTNTSRNYHELSVSADGIRLEREYNRFLGESSPLISAGGRLYAGSLIIDPSGPLVIGGVPFGNYHNVIDTSRDRLFAFNGTTLYETELADQAAVRTRTGVYPASVLDTALVGDTVAATTANDRLVLLPLIGPPRRPRYPTASPGDGQVTVRWRAPREDGGSPVTAYRIYRDGVPVHEADGADRSWVDTGRSNGVESSYRLVAVTETSESPPTDPVTATPYAPLQGDVLDVDGHPVAGVWVLAVSTNTGRSIGAVTDADGHYEVFAPPAQYRVGFVDPTGDHASEWHEGHPLDAIADADPITVGEDGATVDADLGHAGRTATITGNASDATTGDPIAGAWVLVLDASTFALVGGATTDPDGSFSIDGLVAGSYHVEVVDPTGAHRTAFHGSDTHGALVAVEVGAAETATADVSLPPATAPTPGPATILGTVTRTGPGTQPVPGAWLAAVDANGRVAGTTTAAPDGSYQLDLATGSYRVIAIDPTAAHGAEWSDGRPPTEFALVTPTEVDETDPVRVDFALSPTGPTGAVTGVLTETGTGEAIDGGWVAALGPDGGTFAAGAVVGADGSYTLSGLTSGSYRVVLIDPSGRHRVEWHRDATMVSASTPVVVQAGAATRIDGDLTG